MDFQLVAVFLIFIAALFLLGRHFYNQMVAKKSSGCGDCGMNDLQAKK
jgi:hypothetical protein